MDYRPLFALATDAILIVDAHGRCVDANAAAERLTRYDRETLLSMRLGDLTDLGEETGSNPVERLDGRVGQRADRTIGRHDGSTVLVDVRVVPLDAETYGLVLRDLSAGAPPREDLQPPLHPYATLVDLCGAAVVSADSTGSIIAWNHAAEELLGYSASEAVGMAVTELIPPRLRESQRRAFDQHVQGSRSERFCKMVYTQALRKDGAEVPVEISVGAAGKGDQRLFTAVLRDVSGQRHIVEQLNDALQRLQFHVERMPLAYIVWDTDFRVLEWNAAAKRTFGFSKSEALGHHAHDLIVPPDAVRQVERVWSDLLRGDTSSHSVNRNIRKDGSGITCEWFNTPLRDSSGRIRGVASMARDVTEQEMIEARLRNAQKFESLGVLASGVAHDFNSSLMVMLGNASLLRSIKGMPRRAMEHIELMEDAGARANQLIKHLLTYARTGRHNPQRTDVNSVIKDALIFVRSSIGPRHDLALELADDLPPVLADRGQLEQIILNLCLNAAQAMEEGGTVRMLTRQVELTPQIAARCVPHDVRPGRYVDLLVADTGCGIDDAILFRVFDPFFTNKAEGHGLGLAAVLGILRQHHAAARIDSTVGRGTNFHVYFPVHQAQ